MKAKAGMIFAAAVFAVFAAAGEARAQKSLSERSVKVLMGYAWNILPSKFTAPDGTVIVVDKTKQKDVIVPTDTARNVIMVARLSAHAQICDLTEAQTINYRAMMTDQRKAKKWSEQQMLYISHLHLFTIMWLTGNVKLVEKDGGKEVVIGESSSGNERTCSDAEREKVKERIKLYVDSVVGKKS